MKVTHPGGIGKRKDPNHDVRANQPQSLTAVQCRSPAGEGSSTRGRIDSSIPREKAAGVRSGGGR